MTVRNPPVWMQSGTYNALDDRMVTALLSDRDLSATGATLGIPGGVVPGLDQMQVTAPGSGMAVSVSAGAVIVPAAGSLPGAYVCHNDGPQAVTLDIEASGNPRVDLIYASVSDQANGATTSAWGLKVRKGSPSASPTSPTLNANEVPIAGVRVVPASQNGGVNKVTGAQVTDLRTFTSSQGGVHLTRNSAPNPAHTPGRLLYNVDADYLYISNGTSWEYFLTYKAWLDVFAALHPKHAAGANVQRQAGAGVPGVWSANPNLYNSAVASKTLQVPGMRSPSGIFKVSVSSFGRAMGGSAFLGVRVLNEAGGTVVAPSVDYRSLSWYGTVWNHFGSTWMVSGLDANVDYTFRVEFMRNGATTESAQFTSPYIMVEPVV